MQISRFEIIALTHSDFGLSGTLAHDIDPQAIVDRCLQEAAIASAAIRAGEIGVVDLELVDLSLDDNRTIVVNTLRRLLQNSAGRCGIKYDASANLEVGKLLDALLVSAPETSLGLVITNLAEGTTEKELSAAIKALKKRGLKAYIESTTLDEALLAQKCGADAIIAKGHEASGRVSDETLFVLLQQLAPKVTVPYYAFGGVGIHTAAACLVAGAKGAVLDSQLLLTHESTLPLELKSKIANMDGTETALVSYDGTHYYRAFRETALSLNNWQDRAIFSKL